MTTKFPNRRSALTLKVALMTSAATAVLVGGVMLGPRARADSWTVCNQSPEELSAVIAYSLGDGRQYISKGWGLAAAVKRCLAAIYR
jgi:hypothetical protein